MNRKGFTLIETVIALSIFSAVVLSIGLGTTKLQRSVSDSGLRTRAWARADVQIGMARAWPTWGTLENLTGVSYNGTKDGLTTTTVVQSDTLANKRIKRLTVTVKSQTPGALHTPVVRTISIAAP